MKFIIYVGRKPYYYYNTYYSTDTVQRMKRRFKKTRYYVVKTYNKRRQKTGYAMYFDRMIS